MCVCKGQKSERCGLTSDPASHRFGGASREASETGAEPDSGSGQRLLPQLCGTELSCGEDHLFLPLRAVTGFLQQVGGGGAGAACDKVETTRWSSQTRSHSDSSLKRP